MIYFFSAVSIERQILYAADFCGAKRE